MEVILLERIKSLGQMGDRVHVKAGYARNFLLPFKKALRANKDNLEKFEKEKVNLEAKNLETKTRIKTVPRRVEIARGLIILAVFISEVQTRGFFCIAGHRSR